MNRASRTDQNTQRNRKGQGIAEFALLLALIAVAVTLALTSLGQESEDTLGRTGNALAKQEQQEEEEEEEEETVSAGCGM